jgi:hypothetical protein
MDELALVCQAVMSRATGDCEWHPEEIERVRSDRYLLALTPEWILAQLQDYVRRNGCGVIQQRRETREGYRFHRDWYYCVILPAAAFRNGLFVEMILHDADPEAPQVYLVNAHEQRN